MYYISFNCQCGPHVRKLYIDSIMCFIRVYEEGLTKYLNEGNAAKTTTTKSKHDLNRKNTARKENLYLCFSKMAIIHVHVYL